MATKRMMIILLVLLVGLLGAGCSPSESRQAEHALVDYFAYLHDGEYEKAAALYGGEYDVLRDWNPEVDPSDCAALWERGCTVNGLQCLKIHKIGAYEAASPGTFEFWVQFESPGGGVFQTQSQAGGGTKSSFKFTVQKTSDGYVVDELPVYLP
jgi:hypothetical protein